MSKKGESLSLNVIIVAALALLVLVILTFVFMGRMNPFSKDIKNCETLGGVCYPGTSCPQDQGLIPDKRSGVHCLYSDGSIRNDQICCMRMG
jgi:hypothetical protein